MSTATRAVALAGLVTVLVGGAALVPPHRGAVAVVALFSVVTLCVLVTAVRRRRLAHPAAWLAIGTGVTGWAAAAVVAQHQLLDGERLVPGLPEAINLLALPAVIVGAVSVLGVRRRPRRVLAGSETAIVALSASAVVWIVVVDPVLVEGAASGTTEAWYLPAIGVTGLLALLAGRAARRRGGQRRVAVGLGATFVAATVSQAATWLMTAEDPDRFERLLPGVALIPVGLLVATVVGGVLVVDASGDDGDGPRDTVHAQRVIGLTFAAALPLITFGGMVATGEEVAGATVLIVVLSSVVIASTVVARVWGLVLQARELAERRGQVRLAAMVEHSTDVVVVTDVTGTVIYASPGLTAALGYQPNEWVGRSLLDVVDEPRRDEAISRFEELIAGGRNRTIEFETTLVRADGASRHGDVVLVNLLGDDAIDGVVATFRDITEQRDLERQLSHRAFHDELTGLANRALFLDRMDHALRISRPDGEPVMVLFIDLDDFKVVNDAHGHAVGDETLRVVAGHIREATGSGDTAARLGGDEFAVLLEDGGGMDRAIDLGEELLERLSEPVVVGGSEVVVLASIGVAVAPAGASTTSLLREADIAMYEAKRAGKGQVRIFDPAMRRLASRHLSYRNELTSAVERGQLRVVYLPYVDLRTGEVRGAEALVRWHHPEHGEIAPSEFVPIAERTGLIVPIGRWVLGEALDHMATWRDDADLFVSFNLSVAELRQHDLVDHLLAAVHGRGLGPSQVMLEVTETDLMHGGERTFAAVAALRSHGFGVALDDFGAGYCSLSHLQRHPVDMLKIDRAYVAELGQRRSGTTLARAILRLAETLEMWSAAEGVETPEQLHELRRSGCHLGQGYLLSEALEAEVIARRFGRATGELATPGPSR